MISTQMHLFNYSTFGECNGYGQPTLNPDVEGTVKLAIYTTSQNIGDNPLYSNCEYIGFTFDNDINESYVIHYGNKKLKVKYINTSGRFNQVYLTNYD